MSDLLLDKVGRAGRITLNRPRALNALTYEMVQQIAEIIDVWEESDGVDLIVIDAAGEKAFCSGGDIAEMYATATAGDFGYGRRFWADEYRMNARLKEYSKPVVSLLQGFTMGGGVGVGCHASHRVVGETSRIAMPECGIGLVPDVGGSLMLAQAPGRLGEYLGVTSARMDAGDAIFVGFADVFVPEARWADLVAALEESGDVGVIDRFAEDAPDAGLKAVQSEIDTVFAAETLPDIAAALESAGDWAGGAAKALQRNSPLSMACTLEIVRRVRAEPGIRRALEEEFKFTWRSAEEADFIEGIRAQIIDKDRNPKWTHASVGAVTAADVQAMLAPVPQDLWG